MAIDGARPTGQFGTMVRLGTNPITANAQDEVGNINFIPAPHNLNYAANAKPVASQNNNNDYRIALGLDLT